MQVVTGPFNWVPITKSDSINLPGGPPTAIYVGGAGNVVCVWGDGSTDTVAAVAGGYLWLSPVRVNDASTTATGMYALYL